MKLDLIESMYTEASPDVEVVLDAMLAETSEGFCTREYLRYAVYVALKHPQGFDDVTFWGPAGKVSMREVVAKMELQ